MPWRGAIQHGLSQFDNDEARQETRFEEMTAFLTASRCAHKRCVVLDPCLAPSLRSVVLKQGALLSVVGSGHR